MYYVFATAIYQLPLNTVELDKWGQDGWKLTHVIPLPKELGPFTVAVRGSNLLNVGIVQVVFEKEMSTLVPVTK